MSERTPGAVPTATTTTTQEPVPRQPQQQRVTYQRRLTLVRMNPDTGALVRRHSKVLAKPLCAIGRADGCDVVVRREYVGDPFHAVLTTGGAHAPGCTLQNMALPPCAPAQVNDRAVAGSVALRSGDVIGIAGRLFLYEETPVPVAGAPPASSPQPQPQPQPEPLTVPVSPIRPREPSQDDAIASPPVEESQAPLLPDEAALPPAPATPPTAAGSPKGAEEAPLFDDRVLQQCEAAAAATAAETAPGALSADTDASGSMSRGDSGLWLDTPDRRGAPRGKKRGRRKGTASGAGTGGRKRPPPSSSSSSEDDDDDDEEEEEEEENEETSGSSSSSNNREQKRGRPTKRTRTALFREYKFVVSGVERKEALQAALEAEGGVVDDAGAWRAPPLFAAWEPFPRTLLLTEPDAAGALVTTAPVLLCLLCGVPCVDRRWADDSRAQRRLLSPRDYLLPIRLDVTASEARAAGIALSDAASSSSSSSEKNSDDNKEQEQEQEKQKEQEKQQQKQQEGRHTITLKQPVRASLVAQGRDAGPLLRGAGGRPFQAQLHVHDQHGNRVPLLAVEQGFVHVWELILTTLGARVVRETRVHYDVNLHVVRASSSLQRSLKPAPARSSRRAAALPAAPGAAAVPDVSSTWLTHSLLLNVQLPFDDYLYNTNSNTPPPSSRPLS